MRWARLGLHVIVAIAILRLAYPRAGPARRRRLVGWWSSKLVRILGVKLAVTGPRPTRGEVAAMIVANHVSWMDIYVISSVRPTRFIAKNEIRDWPVLGWIAERSGTLFLRRERRRDTARISAEVHEAFAARDCVGLFPEGGTSEGDRLLPFHSSLFQPAVANAAHVHPAAIRYEHPDGSLCVEAAYAGDTSFMQSLRAIVGRRRIVARLMFAEPIEAEGRTRRDVAAQAHAAVARLLGVAEAGRAPRKRDGPPGEPR